MQISIFTEIVGTLGAICLGICALPQAIHCYKTKSASGISWGFLLLWLIGELLTMGYVYITHGLDLILFLNYTLNVCLIAFIMRYK